MESSATRAEKERERGQVLVGIRAVVVATRSVERGHLQDKMDDGGERVLCHVADGPEGIHRQGHDGGIGSVAAVDHHLLGIQEREGEHRIVRGIVSRTDHRTDILLRKFKMTYDA